MATMKSWAQDVITCVLCDKPCRKFCNDCQVNLCVDCLGKHVGELQFQSHDIVHLKNRNIHAVFPDCKTHNRDVKFIVKSAMNQSASSVLLVVIKLMMLVN